MSFKKWLIDDQKKYGQLSIVSLIQDYIMPVSLIILLLILNSSNAIPAEITKTISVNLAMQRVGCFENGRKVKEFPISSGKNDLTPKGVTSITDKAEVGYSELYSCDLPYFTVTGFTNIGFHAGVLPGYPANHGCIRMHKDDAKWLYYWTPIGTKVTIYSGGK